jgi:hypothetical protein
MGEIADMMLDGTLCEECGVYLDDDEGACGYPRYCEDCEDPSDSKHNGPNSHKKPEKIKCPHCEKKCGGEQGLDTHIKAKHSSIKPSDERH